MECNHRAGEGVLPFPAPAADRDAGRLIPLDFLLFFLFWEVMLVPMYFLIGISGTANRLLSAIEFFLYTLVGGVVMLLGILSGLLLRPQASTWRVHLST